MLKLIWLILVAFVVSIAAIWMLDHDGQVVITWFGYEARTSVLAAFLITIVFAVLVFAVSYLVARILAIRFPNILNLFFKKSRLKRLEKLLKRSQSGLDMMAKLLMAIETRDVKASEKLHNKLSKLIKNPQLNNFLLGKIAFDNKNFSKAESYFAKLDEDKYSKILVLKSKFKLALENQDDISAIAYAKQILSIKRDNAEIALKLFSLYKKRGLWHETKSLISEYGLEKFGDELQKRDIAVMNTALAAEYYRAKNFSQVIKHAKAALKADKDFLPATELLLRSWIKRGFTLKASWTIKKLWRENPHLILAEIYDLIYRKASAKNRIRAMKKLVALNSKTHLGKLAIGLVAFRVGDFDMAREFLRLSVLQEKNYRAYKLLSYAERNSGDKEKAQKYAQKAKMINHNDHYSCGNCGHSSSKWSSKCSDCGMQDSLEWNS
jgi:HemY protein